MASRKEVAAKAERLGGKLIVTSYEAQLISPKGKLWDGYHYQNDYFEDGKQCAWDYFWIAMKNQTDCDCGCGKED